MAAGKLPGERPHTLAAVKAGRSARGRGRAGETMTSIPGAPVWGVVLSGVQIPGPFAGRDTAPGIFLVPMPKSGRSTE